MLDKKKKENIDVKIVLDKDAIIPNRAHMTDAGLDLFTPYDIEIKPWGSATIDTGVHIELPHGYFGKIESKSGLNVKHDVVCCGGVIDEGYTGSICVKLYCFNEDGYKFDKGDKIAQIIIQPYLAPSLTITNNLEETERGDNGFGSTGK